MKGKFQGNGTPSTKTKSTNYLYECVYPGITQEEVSEAGLKFQRIWNR